MGHLFWSILTSLDRKWLNLHNYFLFIHSFYQMFFKIDLADLESSAEVEVEVEVEVNINCRGVEDEVVIKNR